MRKLFDARRENAIQQQLLLRAERPLQRRVSTLIKSAYQGAADNIQAGLLAADIGVAPTTGDMRRALYVHGDATARAFAKRLKGQLKGAYQVHVRKQEATLQELAAAALAARGDFAPVFEGMMQQFLVDHVATRVTQVNDTTKESIRRIIQQGMENGDTLEQIAKTLRERSVPMSAYRAHLIARTETHTAANAGQQAEAEASEFPMRKQWLSVRDSRTRGNDSKDRFDHREMNRETADLRGMFNVQGDLIEYPGDPRAHPANSINCRCCVGYIVL